MSKDFARSFQQKRWEYYSNKHRHACEKIAELQSELESTSFINDLLKMINERWLAYYQTEKELAEKQFPCLKN